MKGSLLPAALALLPAALADWTWEEAVGKSIKFTSVPGYFQQDDPDTNPTGFDYVRPLAALDETLLILRCRRPPTSA